MLTLRELDQLRTTLDRCHAQITGAALRREVQEAWALVNTKRAEALEASAAPMPLYPADWPRCVGCGDYALDGHLTCGRLPCDEAGARAMR